MDKLQEQSEAMVQYFTEGCKPEGRMRLGLEVEHFITHLDSTPADYDTIQKLMHTMQATSDKSILVDSLYAGYSNERYGIMLKSGCQLEINIVPCDSVAQAIKIYNEFYAQLCEALASAELRVYNIGCHPSTAAEKLPAIPNQRFELMDNYFKKSGNHGIQMMRGTASTPVSIDYFNEQDFIKKYRVACLLSPLLALLTDNSPIYEGKASRGYCSRTCVWDDVDPERCGIPKNLMDKDFGFEAYAKYVLQNPAIIVRKDGETVDAKGKTAEELYDAELTKEDIEQILSMQFFDSRLKRYIEIRSADSMPPRYVAAYAQLLRAIFSSPAAMNTVERRYAGMGVAEIEAAKVGVCCNGYSARVYGKPVAGELVWLVLLAKSRSALQEDRRYLDPLMKLPTTKKTIWETEHYV